MADTDKVVLREIEDEMKESYLSYAMSVIVGRALPDARDGLKPVHRRILFAMNDMGMQHSKPFKKCARIVGEVLGKYHPHGDSAVYESLVRMVQDFSMRYPLIEGQGNFGSIDGDNAAAMRYTEARMAKISEEILADIDKETVDFVPNFDGSLEEPFVLPTKIPNLLVNGSSGIAVGMATNIPPHNLIEVCDAVNFTIENPSAEVSDLMNYIKGPDFPTAGIIYGTEGIKSAYTTGRGSVRIRAKYLIEQNKNRERIIVNELPYQVNKAQLIEEMANLVNEEKITGISNIKDESNKEGIRIVIDLKKDITPEVVVNQLFKHTRLEISFGTIMLALVGNEPKVLNLKGLIENFIGFRKEVITKRTKFDLRKAEEKMHILEGFIIALADIDNVIRKIKESKDVESAKNILMSSYSLTEIQSKAILDMKLQRLSSMEREKIKEEHKETGLLINELNDILGSEQRIKDIIKKELSEIKQKYGDKRRTEISNERIDNISEEQMIEEEDVVVTITHKGYVKRIPLTAYKKQARGGKGIIGASAKEEDWIERLFVTSTHSTLLLFTNKGQAYWLKVYDIPEASRQAVGKAIVNLVGISKDEKINAAIAVKDFSEKLFVLMATKNGTIKKTELAEFARPRSTGIRAITLDDNDNLVEAVVTNGEKQIMLATADGMAIKFHENDARPMGRTASGVRGIKLDNDSVIGMIIADDNDTVLTITENGFGKRSPISDYRLISRGGSGVINIKCSERNGKVIAIKKLNDEDEVMMISQNGIMIRVSAKQIPVIGRNTQGVTLMKLENDHVVDAANIVSD